MMKSAISDIYEGLEILAALPEDCAAIGEENLSGMYDLEDEIEGMLDGELREKFQKLMHMQGRRAVLQGKERFIEGFRLGMQIMLDTVVERKKQK